MNPVQLLLAGTLALGVAGTAHAAKTVPVTVQVVDEAGAPVTSAIVRIAEEGERHRVHGETGAWQNTSLFPAGGEEVPFKAGLALQIEVFAPGFERVVLEHVVAKKENELTATLKPMDLEPSALAAAEVDALAAARAWKEAAAAHAAGPSDDTQSALDAAQQAAGKAVLAWLEAARAAGASTERAEALCEIAADDPASCKAE